MKIYHVDAFTAIPFRGNPAAVCILDAPRSDDWYRGVAAEMNLSETAFLLPRSDGYELRWFTPQTEVTLCGHATLASAHVLWEEGFLSPAREALFHTQSGLLTITQVNGWIHMDFPARKITGIAPDPELNRILGLNPCYTGQFATPQGNLYLVEAASPDIVRGLAPDFTKLSTKARAVAVTARSGEPDYDFISRYFAPMVGISEDPVTGSAHCCLAPYWGQKLGKTVMIGFQASARSGMVGCEWRDDRVILKGQAVTVFRGEVKV